MKTDYLLHNQAYEIKKANGEIGWSTKEETEENYRCIKPIMDRSVTENSQLLELGCGAGDLTLKLLSHTKHIIGIDISENAISWAKSKTSIPNFESGNLINQNLFPQNRFDVVVDSCLIHCIIGEDRKLVFNNINHWLKPNGMFVLYTMCGEPTPELEFGYCKESMCIMRGDIAIRYLGKPDDILKEVESCNFRTIQHELIDNMLVSLHQSKLHQAARSFTS